MTNKSRLVLSFFCILHFSFLISFSVFAEDFYCEVMSVEGQVTLSNATTSGRELAEGDLLSVEDVIAVGSSSYVDLAYDRDWNNVTRVEENSSIRIRSLYPTVIDLNEGGVFAKLKSLPKESSFDVKTPTAIASVRGTEYRTTYTGGETQVYNVSDSDVYVYGFDAAGQQQAEPVIIRNTEKTFIQKRGDAPQAPRQMESRDVSNAAKFQRGIEQQVMRNIDRGRVGKLPDVGAIEHRMQERRQRGGQDGAGKSLRSGENSPQEGNRPGQPQTMKGDEAHQEIRGGGFVSGQGIKERKATENRFEGRGLSEPYFPGDERSRSGGPQPAGMPDRRWKTGGDNAETQNSNGQGNQPQGKQQQAKPAAGKPQPRQR